MAHPYNMTAHKQDLARKEQIVERTQELLDCIRDLGLLTQVGPAQVDALVDGYYVWFDGGYQTHGRLDGLGAWPCNAWRVSKVGSREALVSRKEAQCST